MKTNEIDIKPNERPELIRLARMATGPAIGDSDFWQEVIAHLDAIGDEHPAVEPRPMKE